MNEVRTLRLPPLTNYAFYVQTNNNDAATATTPVLLQLILLLAILPGMRYATTRTGINVPSWAAAKVENGSI
jgi:hypothetical protein